MKKCSVLFSCLMLFVSLKGQNLVNNPGFENYSVLPNTYNELDRAIGWSNCNGNYVTQGNWGSPDYLSLLGSGLALLPCGYIACTGPHSGNGIAGFITYNGFLPDNREYIRTYLTSPMAVGQQYQVSFYLTCGTGSIAKYVTNNIGVRFSVDSTWQLSPYKTLPCTPQFNISSTIDTTAWKKYSFTYIADSAYKYITIGNYFNDANTLLTVKTATSNQLYSYYMIDDISVTVNVANGVKEISLPENEVSVFPNPNQGEFTVRGHHDEVLTIANELGECIQKIHLDSENGFRARINNLQSGVYFVIGSFSKNKIVVIR